MRAKCCESAESSEEGEQLLQRRKEHQIETYVKLAKFEIKKDSQLFINNLQIVDGRKISTSMRAKEQVKMLGGFTQGVII